MTIDERLATTEFPLPAIREVNMAKHATGISLGLGELKTFPVDNKIIEAMNASLLNGGTSYTQNAGLPELRRVVAAQQEKQDGYSYTEENVVVTVGVQNAVYTTVKTLSLLGAKRVLVPQVNFGIYKKIPAEFGLEVCTYPLTTDFGVDINGLSAMLKPDDIIIINSPGNPTGRVFSAEEQQQLADLLREKLTEGYVISDEIYGRLVYEGAPFRSFSNYFERTIVVDGISKSGAVAGLRVGWVIARTARLAKAITSNNATIISTPPTANQFAAIPVVEGETQSTIDNYNIILKRNRDLVTRVLDRLYIPYVLPTGSFYIFPDLKDFVGENTKEFCLSLAKKENGVVVIPGVAFGAPNHIRISLASAEIEEGMRRFEKAMCS
ncbi:pyridoxal phosphate-dependent aminotransferase [Marinilabiliaceae bacterium JC017]|nr:pyridoxal phosphate-dependent aminotransferase [Marinilabiliaceae bacterium JC017]